MSAREISVDAGDVTLAGSIWLPADREPAATVYMHPGSGPSDRDNDVYYPPIREHLLAAGFAVSSFDKRGVGGSTGRWQEAGIADQADDALACVSALVSEDLGPVGLFGHSQGGWVVVEAAGRGAPVAFVVTNAGPGVTPAVQERFSARRLLSSRGASPDEVETWLAGFDGLVALLRNGYRLRDVPGWIEGVGIPGPVERFGLPLFPDDEQFWDFAALIFDYDPRTALERIRVPVLALFGAADRIVPVEESIAIYREAVSPELLSVEVFPGGSHRILVGEPPRHAEGYFETLSAFVAGAVG
jgi:pimeloyl-ACP methyl ester carboxylesterase